MSNKPWSPSGLFRTTSLLSPYQDLESNQSIPILAGVGRGQKRRWAGLRVRRGLPREFELRRAVTPMGHGRCCQPGSAAASSTTRGGGAVRAARSGCPTFCSLGGQEGWGLLCSSPCRAVEELLRLGADPNLVLDDGVAAVHLAARASHPRALHCLRMLLRWGADPNAR